MRRVLPLLLILLAGCTTWGGGFMGYPDNRARKIEEQYPEIQDYLRGVTTMTKVQEATYNDYQRAMQNDEIYAQERNGDYVYWAVKTQANVPLPPERPGQIATPYVDVIQRYRAPVPPGR